MAVFALLVGDDVVYEPICRDFNQDCGKWGHQQEITAFYVTTTLMSVTSNTIPSLKSS